MYLYYKLYYLFDIVLFTIIIIVTTCQENADILDETHCEWHISLGS